MRVTLMHYTNTLTTFRITALAKIIISFARPHIYWRKSKVKAQHLLIKEKVRVKKLEKKNTIKIATQSTSPKGASCEEKSNSWAGREYLLIH